ncbi:hypothetical protein PAMP_006142 [Pampus punctatissimus]
MVADKKHHREEEKEEEEQVVEWAYSQSGLLQGRAVSESLCSEASYSPDHIRQACRRLGHGDVWETVKAGGYFGVLQWQSRGGVEGGSGYLSLRTKREQGLDWCYQLLVSLPLCLPELQISQGLSPSYLPLTLDREEVLRGLGPTDNGAADSGELDLSGIDDSEIELYLLNDKEIKIKTALWMAENSDYLKEQKEKEAKIAKEKELGIYKEKKPRGPGKKRAPIRANTADEAIEKMLEQKKISSKINYDVLKDLNIKPGASPARKAESPKQPSTTKLTGRNRNPARAPLSLSTPLSTLGKRLLAAPSAPLKALHRQQGPAVLTVLDSLWVQTSHALIHFSSSLFLPPSFCLSTLHLLQPAAKQALPVPNILTGGWKSSLPEIAQIIAL